VCHLSFAVCTVILSLPARNVSMIAPSLAGITHILCAASYDSFPQAYHPGVFQYLILGAADTPEQDLTQYFPKTNAFISGALREGGRVYVHCYAGVSRAPTLVAAYLIKEAGMPLSAALSACSRVRPQVRPNHGFMRQLEAYAADVGAQSHAGHNRGIFAPGGAANAPTPESPAPKSPSYGGVASHYFQPTAPGANGLEHVYSEQPLHSIPTSYPNPLQHGGIQPAGGVASYVPSHYTSAHASSVGTSAVSSMVPGSSLIPQSSVAHMSKARGADAYGSGVELGTFGSPAGTYGFASSPAVYAAGGGGGEGGFA